MESHHQVFGDKQAPCLLHIDPRMTLSQTEKSWKVEFVLKAGIIVFFFIYLFFFVF